MILMKRRPVHPGEALSAELGVSPAGLARRIDVPPNRISQIVNGKRHVSADTALRLAQWFGTSPQFWTNLQGQFDLAVAGDRAGDAIDAHPIKPEDRPSNERGRIHR